LNSILYKEQHVRSIGYCLNALILSY